MSEWLKLQDLAEVEVTSEADGYPVEEAFNFGAGPGWRAATPGEQRIRLIFDEPQSWDRSPASRKRASSFCVPPPGETPTAEFSRRSGPPIQVLDRVFGLSEISI
jgi:hypothetical protein